MALEQKRAAGAVAEAAGVSAVAGAAATEVAAAPTAAAAEAAGMGVAAAASSAGAAAADAPGASTAAAVDVVQITPTDTVAVALRPLRAGETVAVAAGRVVTMRNDIPQGHKLAIAAMAAGDPVIKYGVAIGHATESIEPGAWVHTSNVATNLAGEVTYRYEPQVHELAPRTPETFMGFRRSDGRVGIRNELWIVPTVGCVNEIAQALVAQNRDLVQGTVDGIQCFPHPFGCSQTGADHAQTRRLLASLVHHPNAGGVLVLSLGCENLTHEQFIDELGPYDEQRVKFLICQDVEDELAAGRALLQELAAYAGQAQREPVPASELVIGLKCGGSDGLSGITANPTIGRVSDLLVAAGGSSILTEVPEMFGAESFLLNRCRTPEVFDAAASMLNGFKGYFISHGETVYENPSPGNKAGGITTLEDKSCGCVQKGGTAPVADVLEYGERVRTKGLSLLCGPGNDLVATTALAAAGAHLVLFSTGRGTPFAGPVPTLKIFSNSALAARKGAWMDFNAGVVADGVCSLDEAGEELYQLVLEVASGGKRAAAERLGGAIAIWKDGVTL